MPTTPEHSPYRGVVSNEQPTSEHGSNRKRAPYSKRPRAWLWGSIAALLAVFLAGATLGLVRRQNQQATARFELSVARKYLDQGRQMEALEHLAAAADADPCFGDAYIYQTDTLLAMGERDRAERTLKLALERAPNHYGLRRYLGQLLWLEGRVDDAIVQYRIALELEPTSQNVHSLLGMALAGVGQNAEALQYLSRAVELDPTDSEAHKNLADLLIAEGTPRRGLEHLEKAIDLNPADTVAVNRLALLLSTSPDANVRNGSRAVELAEQLCQATDNGTAEFLDTLGAAYAEAGRFDEAIDAATAALALSEPGPLAEGIRQRQMLYEAGQCYRYRGQ